MNYYLFLCNRYHPELRQIAEDLDHHKLRRLVCETALADENENILCGLIPPDDISGDVDIEKWMQKMKLTGSWCDEPFIQLTSYHFKRNIIIIPIIKEHGNNGTGRIVFKARQSTGSPFYLLNYYNEHFQSIIPK